MSVHGRLQGGGGDFILLGHLNLLKLHRKYSIFDAYWKNFEALRTTALSGRFCPFYRLDRVWGYLWVCLLALVTITGETKTHTPIHFFNKPNLKKIRAAPLENFIIFTNPK